MHPSVDFAHRVLRAASGPVTHLKLQKLVFYAYGAAVAHDEDVPEIVFHSWKHGPVCVPVYEYFKPCGSAELSHVGSAGALTGAAAAAVRVYEKLSAWQLRQESHLEAPWIATRLGDAISSESVRGHFCQKFSTPVYAPRNLVGSWSLAVDGLPALRAGSLHELAKALEAQA